MKTLSLTQPFATLVALGEKHVETRSWPTPFRGPIAIHAAKRFPTAERALARTHPAFTSVLAAHGLLRVSALPLGAVVAVAELAHVLPTGPRGRFWLDDLSAQERAFGNYALGRYAWFLANVRALREPIPAQGHLGLWDWQPPDNLAELLVVPAVAAESEVLA